MLNLIAALLFSLSACSSGPDVPAMLADVEAKAAAKDYAGAVTGADTALKLPEVTGDPASAWRFESARLGALADGGKGADVKTSLERLSGTFAAQVTCPLRLSLADRVRAAGDGAGYTDLLDAGLKACPQEPSFQSKIDEAKSSADPEEIERLKALGYL
jgi:hypothetical protein